MHELDLELIDLRDKIAALNPKYVGAPVLTDRHEGRINDVTFSRADNRLYITYADAYLFYSEDDFDTLHEVREINYHGGELASRTHQTIDVVGDTVPGSVIAIGRDRRRDAVGGWREVESGVVWRKAEGSESFIRQAQPGKAWATSKNTNITAGYFGASHAPMIAFGVYTTEDAHFYFSLDDGVTWRRQSMRDVFAFHVHELYLHRSVNNQRVARLWVTGGDDPSGAKSGLIAFESLNDDGTLGGMRWVFRERPGYRLVSLDGNGKHLFIGNESTAGGVLKLQDNVESIEAADFEYVLGKSRHDYHQFRGMIATWDGVLVAGSDSYGYTGDTVRADSGGHLYVSNNEGATFVEIPFGGRWTTALTYDDRAFWFAMSGSSEAGVDFSERRTTLARLKKPSPYARLSTPYVCKAVVVDSSALYETAKYEQHPVAQLAAGERTPRVDLGAYRTIAVTIDALDRGRFVVEALAVYNWRLDENVWRDVATIDLATAGETTVMLSVEASQNRWYRLRNDGERAVSLRLVAFVGKDDYTRETVTSTSVT